MNESEYVTLPRHGLTLPRVQVEAIAACVQVFEDQGIAPTWHMNACGCCASVHPLEDGHHGYLIGPDGEFDYVEILHEHG